MLREILTDLLPLLAPLAIYMAWVAYMRARARANDDEPPVLERGPIFWSIAAGFVLMVASLMWLAFSTGDKPGQGQYIPPRYEGGKIIPPEYKKE